MILTDYLRSKRDITWDYALQCGVTHGVIRLPEDGAFDVCDPGHWRAVYRRFTDAGITPLVVEPMPNALHDPIKTGTARRDECIEKALKMLPIMGELGIRTLCFNFMAHIGWLRTNSAIPERGGALVTGFDLAEYVPGDRRITQSDLWENYTYFIRAAAPVAERCGVRLALHPDDPPLPCLGGVERIMTSHENLKRALDLAASPAVGLTMCQATYQMMGEDLSAVIPEMKERIFFIHFRNATGTGKRFRETFHDNGDIDMAQVLRLYRDCGIDVPIRVDHVPTMAGETDVSGYAALGRLYAIGYLRGLLEGLEA